MFNPLAESAYSPAQERAVRYHAGKLDLALHKSRADTPTPWSFTANFTSENGGLVWGRKLFTYRFASLGDADTFLYELQDSDPRSDD